MKSLRGRTSLFLLVSAFLLLAGCVAPEPDASGSPYVDQLDGEVRGLSAEEIQQLRSGAGMGLARPAELNGYPGPLHVLELADELGLTHDQRAAVQALREEVVAEAGRIGEEIILRHARLEERFRTGEIDAEGLRSELAGLEALYAELRFVHLETHLDMFPLLTEHQRMRYDQLRGYAEAGEETHEDGGHEGH